MLGSKFNIFSWFRTRGITVTNFKIPNFILNSERIVLLLEFLQQKHHSKEVKLFDLQRMKDELEARVRIPYEYKQVARQLVQMVIPINVRK